MNTSTYFSKFNDNQATLRKCIEMLKADQDGTGRTPLDKDLLLAKLEEMVIPQVSEGAKKEYPVIMEELILAHTQQTMGSFNAGLKARGKKINTTVRRDVSSHLTWSQIATMVETAVMLQQGIDPIELLIAYGRFRLAADPKANILHLVEQTGNAFEDMLPGVLAEAEAFASGGSADAPAEETHEAQS